MRIHPSSDGMGLAWGGYMHEFINEMLLIVVIEANGSVEYYNYLR